MTPPKNSSPFADLARKHDLWRQFTVRAVEARYRGSYMGILWTVINPLLLLALYYTVFGVIFKGRFGVFPEETPVDYALAMFLGLTLFQMIAETIGTAPLAVLATPNLVKKVVFPLDILPLAQVGASWVNLAIGLVLAVGAVAVFGRGVTLVGLAWLPVIVFPMLLLSAGLAWLLAALGIFFRDIAQIMPFLSQVVLYASAVMYTPVPPRVPAAVWQILKWNPVLHTIVLAREVVLWNLPIHATRLGYTYVCGIAMFGFGRWVFHKLQPAFADVI
jgi:lipopolysaccharide transport system permease protein